MANQGECLLLWSSDEAAMRICVEHAQTIWGDRVLPPGRSPLTGKDSGKNIKPILVFLLPVAVSKAQADREGRKDFVNWLKNEERIRDLVMWNEFWLVDDGSFTPVAFGQAGLQKMKIPRSNFVDTTDDY